MAMVEIFTSVVVSPTLTARLVMNDFKPVDFKTKLVEMNVVLAF